MSWLKEFREQPWRITIVAVGGLLVAIIVAGVVGLLLNRNIESTAEGTKYVVNLENEGDDLRAAVLDVRHYHRNLYFQVEGGAGMTRGGVADFEDSYDRLEHEIGELEKVGVRDPEMPQPEEIRGMAEVYYRDFGSAIELAATDEEAFIGASDRGLRQLEEMEAAATRIDESGEDLSEDALQEVDQAADTATVVLIAVIGGLVLVGAGLAFAAMRVVNELRKLYADQQVAAQKLAEASRAKTGFIADASHELRTPLTMLRGNAEIGLKITDPDIRKEILEEIVGESGKMSRIVEDLLLLAKSDSTELPLDLETVPVELFMAELAGRAEILARERGAKLETRLAGEGNMRIDSGRIEQAVLILVDNAAKFGPDGGGITLASSTRSGELRIMVEDHGPGIPREELPHIFERFYRVDKTRARKLGGSGLGLPIARTITEAHGGRIEAASRRGEGTRMSLYLRLLDETNSGEQTASHRGIPHSQ